MTGKPDRGVPLNDNLEYRPRQHDQLIVPYNESCQRLGGISRTTLWELVRDGELVRVKIGTRGFITAASIAAYVDRLTAAASA